jgi:hypothetical protein
MGIGPGIVRIEGVTVCEVGSTAWHRKAQVSTAVIFIVVIATAPWLNATVGLEHSTCAFTVPH